jgi:redox-sensing transcriptional repressor
VKARRIPVATVERLPLYLRELEEMAEAGQTVVSSAELARRVGLTSEQIRKDLAYFGAFGTRGIGYRPAELALAIRGILGLKEPKPVAVLGVGNLGTALIRHFRTRERDLQMVAAYDLSPDKVGHALEGCPVYAVDELEQRWREHPARIAILAVPPEAAMELFRRLKLLGVEAVLNFSPAKITDPVVFVKNLDLSTELQSLAFFTSHQEEVPS